MGRKAIPGLSDWWGNKLVKTSRQTEVFQNKLSNKLVWTLQQQPAGKCRPLFKENLKLTSRASIIQQPQTETFWRHNLYSVNVVQSCIYDQFICSMLLLLLLLADRMLFSIEREIVQCNSLSACSLKCFGYGDFYVPNHSNPSAFYVFLLCLPITNRISQARKIESRE